VDDHSTDGSFETIRRFHRQDPRIGGCRLAENRGQQNALFCGITRSGGDLIITMDDDRQHPADVLPGLVERIGEGWDTVYSVRRDGNRPWILRTGTGLTDLFFRLFVGKPAGVEIGSYRIMTRELADRFCHVRGEFVYISALIFRSAPKPRVCSFRYKAPPEALGKDSRFSLAGRIRLFGRLFRCYGPFRSRRIPRGKPYRVEETL